MIISENFNNNNLLHMYIICMQKKKKRKKLCMQNSQMVKCQLGYYYNAY